ncbi:hypothetical protein M2263_000834 [Providencia alcalifaciens]|nr:hypothetical protein [Providencia alcalifaciens]
MVRLSAPKIAEKLTNKIQFTGTGKITAFKKETITKKEYDLLSDNVINALSEPLNLIGKTINPKTAEKLTNKIQFTGTGKITAFKKEIITKKEYDLLSDNVINPLSETPHIVKNRIRTPGEVMIDIAILIQTANQPVKNKMEIENLIKFNWLDGTLSHQSINSIIDEIKSKIGEDPVLIDEINQIMSSLESEPFITKRKDNYYGRLFETELSKYIIETPNFNMMKIRDSVSSFIINDFIMLPCEQKKYLCQYVVEQMEADTPAWRYDLSHANDFMDTREPEKFIEIMRYTGKYSIPLVLSIAVRYINKSRGVASIINKASEYFLTEGNRQRNVIETMTFKEQLISDAHGILIPYQKSIISNYNVIGGKGIRPIDKAQQPADVEDLTEHDFVALMSERAIGVGMSGSSNVLHFLFNELQLQDKNFPMDDAKLSTASWLTYSGGHSFNEAYSTFDVMTRGHFKPLSFNRLCSSNGLAEKAISHSYNKVLAEARRLKYEVNG